MADRELAWRIAEGPGNGIASASQNLAKALVRAGLHVFTHRHYPSRIRGGYTYTEARVSADPVKSRGDGYNFLPALGDSLTHNPNEGAYYSNEGIKPPSENLDELDEGGIIVYDSGLLDASKIEDLDKRVEENDWHVYSVDLRIITRKHGREVMHNTADVAVTCAIASIGPDVTKSLMSDTMPDKILEPNLTVFGDAYGMVQEEYDAGTPDVSAPTGEHDKKQVPLPDSDAITYGVIDEGYRSIAGYPVTPWTEVFTTMTQNLPELGGISEQVGDEIVMAVLAISTFYADVKTMSGSPGGDLSFMSEPLGLAEVTKTPFVLVEVIRVDPSTGMPTKPKQFDLEHILCTPQGDSHRIIFTPGNAAETYYQMRRAFQIIYGYQIPPIILCDQKLGGELSSVPASVFDEESNANLGSILTGAELEDTPRNGSGKYQRFQHDTENGVSPRSPPGQKGGRYLVTGNKHTPTGRISEPPESHVAQANHHMQEVDNIHAELDAGGELNAVYGDEDTDLGLTTFGSQRGTVEETVDVLSKKSHTAKVLGVFETMSFPKQKVTNFLDSVNEALVVEMTVSAQFHGPISKGLGGYGDQMSSLLKYNGSPFEPADIIEGFETALLEGEELPDNRTKFVPKVGE